METTFTTNIFDSFSESVFRDLTQTSASVSLTGCNSSSLQKVPSLGDEVETDAAVPTTTTTTSSTNEIGDRQSRLSHQWHQWLLQTRFRNRPANPAADRYKSLLQLFKARTNRINERSTTISTHLGDSPNLYPPMSLSEDSAPLSETGITRSSVVSRNSALKTHRWTPWMPGGGLPGGGLPGGGLPGGGLPGSGWKVTRTSPQLDPDSSPLSSTNQVNRYRHHMVHPFLSSPHSCSSCRSLSYLRRHTEMMRSTGYPVPKINQELQSAACNECGNVGGTTVYKVNSPNTSTTTTIQDGFPVAFHTKEIFVVLPIKTVAEFDSLERRVGQNPRVKDSLFYRLSRIGGKDASDCLTRIMKAMLTIKLKHEILSQEGNDGTPPFHTSKIIQIAFDAVKVHCPDVTEDALKTALGDWQTLTSTYLPAP